MSKTFKLQVVTPDRSAITEQVSFVSLPGAMGSFGVLAGHAAFLSALKKGSMKVTQDGNSKTYPIGEGFAEVKGDSVIVLTETIEGLEDPNADR
jgi:F-type H+-transporting ATPase subunit epsilon